MSLDVTLDITDNDKEYYQIKFANTDQFKQCSMCLLDIIGISSPTFQ